MISAFFLIAALLLSFGASWALTGLVRQKLLARAIMDVPNERSMHKKPVPRGGGLAVMGVIFFGLFALLLFFLAYPAIRPEAVRDSAPFFMAEAKTLALLLVALGLLQTVSWLDDKKGLGAGVRLGTHLLAATIGSLALGDEALVFGGLLPLWADHLLLIVGWAWFMNLTNFMDGIDGITGVETISVTAGAVLIPFAAAFTIWGWPADGLGLGQMTDLIFGAIVIGACGGFLIHNWHPAKIFLGDVGSVPLGFLMGFLLLKLAVSLSLASAFILPLYYLADSGITLAHRALKGEKIWQPHRHHFYQRATAGEGRPTRVVGWILAANLLLLPLAGAAPFYPLLSLLGAFIVVALLLARMHKSGQKGAP